MAIEIGGAQSDLLNVNGAASLGGTLALTFVTPPTAGASRILAANSITGTFASVTTSGLGGSVFGVSYRPTEVDVVTQGANAGEAVSGFARDSFQTLLDLHDIALAHAATAYCHGADAPASPTAMPECQSFTVWRQLNVGGGAVDGSGAIDGYSTRWIGATAGIDYHSDGDFAFGVFASYARKTLGVHTSGDTVTTDAVALGASAGMQALGGDLATLLTYGASFGQSRRAVATAAGTVIARGSPRGDQFGASLQYDHDVLLPGLSIRARAGYADITQDAFAETDGSLYDLAFQRGDFSNWYASAELRYRHAFRLRSGTMVIPDIGAGVRTIMGQDNYALATNFANATGPAFVTAGPPRQDASATLDLGLTIEGRRGDAIFIRAQGSANGSEQEGLVSVGGHFAL